MKKKLLSAFLCVLMLLSVLPLTVFAQVNAADRTISIKTEIWKEEDGTPVKAEKVAPGDAVTARVYIGTNYYTPSGNLNFFFDKNFFEFEGELNKLSYAATDPEATYIDDVLTVVYDSIASPAIIELLGEDFADTHGLVTSMFFFKKNVILSADTMLFEIPLKVKSTASGYGAFEFYRQTIAGTDNELGDGDIAYNKEENSPLGAASSTFGWFSAQNSVSVNNSAVCGPCIVTFDANGGEFSNGKTSTSSTVEPGDIPDIMSLKDRTGYDFVGWALTSDAKEAGTVTPAAGNTTYYAVWIPKTFKAYFSVSGQPFTQTECVYGEAVVLPRSPEIKGMTFKSWSPAVPNTTPAEDMYFSAVLEPTTYYATLLVDGKEYKKIAFTYTQESLSLPAVPEKEGNTGEWEKYIIDAKDMTIKAIYTPNKYIASLMVDGKTYKEIEYTYGQKSISLPEAPKKEGFDGKWESYSLTAGGCTINAVYTPKHYIVDILVDGKKIGETEYNYGDTTLDLSAFTVPEKPGYEGKWDYKLTADGAQVNAVYTPKHYTVDITVDGRKIGETEYNYGDTTLDLSAYTVPEKPGYEGKWDYKLTADGAQVKAVYTPIEYEAVFVADGKTVKTLKYTVETKALIAPEIPAKEGFRGRWENFTPVIGGCTINAVYEVLPSDPAENVVIKTASAQTINYRSIVTITAKASGLPEGYHLAIYVGGSKKADGTAESVSYKYGEIKSDINYTVKVVDANGKVLKDLNSNEVSKDGGKITVNAKFFKKLVAFFKGLFKKLPLVEVKP